MMAEIYKSAVSVIVWLGPASHDSSLAFKCIQNMSSIANDVPNDVLSRLGLHEGDSPETAQAIFNSKLSEERQADLAAGIAELGKAVTSSLPPAEELAALENLFTRSWWTRVWTLQEVVLNSAVIYKCGDAKATENDMFHAASVWLEISSRDSRYQSSKWHLLTVIETKEEFYKDDDSKEKETENDSEMPSALQLLNLVKIYHSRQSSQPVDRIYGLLGLASNADKHLQPDYSKSTESVFTDFAVDCLSLYESLTFLIKAGINCPKVQQHLNLPSWVPNWTQSLSLEPFHGEGLACANAGIGKMTTLPSTSEDRQTLFSKGIIYDVISSIKSVPLFEEVDACYWEDMLPGGNPQPYHLRGHSITQLEALFRAIVLDFAFSHEDGSLGPERLPIKDEDRLFLVFTAFLREIGTAQGQSANQNLDEKLGDILLRWIGETRNGRPDEAILGVLLGQARADSYIHWLRKEVAYARDHGFDILDTFKAPGFSNMYQYTRRMYVGDNGRALFRTDRSLLGSAHVGLRPGDAICVLTHFEAPVALRKCQDGDGHTSWQLLGPCFVLGLMDGEAIAELKEGKLDLETFNIV
ncbi:putative heterokaryon incompatibility protein [Diaporthe ampelina]|uniref:Putative heterokaryon incompatibility protein n=1 Tax=Diaporthe ampelina TaxID=1214573 RepID=A0A0G2HPD7_9PEZI|nr:putative heterokaryon incompatibility protein [Diaporthe ampelina]